jgi:hypothetical protein
MSTWLQSFKRFPEIPWHIAVFAKERLTSGVPTGALGFCASAWLEKPRASAKTVNPMHFFVIVVMSCSLGQSEKKRDRQR